MKYFLKIISLLALFTSCTESYDIVIKNGQVIDGTGTPSQSMDIGITDNEIKFIGRIKTTGEAEVIDASGLVVCPGFVDIHVHLDPILDLSYCESHVRQGATTAIGGPDGGGVWPLGQYLDTLESIGIGMNVGYLIGHNKIRTNVMSLENRAPTNTELDSMKAQVVQAMHEGAFGISTGLKYLPGTFSEIDEVIALSKVAAEKGGIYTSHLRDEGENLFEGVSEAIEIGEKADIPVVLTHHKVIGKPMWGRSSESIALIEKARAKGIDVMADQYPYAASHTGIGVLIPSWARAGGNGKYRQRIADPILKDSIKRQIIYNILNDRGGSDLRRIQFSKVKWNRDLEGQTLHDWCEMEGMEPNLENGAELVIRAQFSGGASCIYHAMSEDDVVNIMKYEHTAIASDGRLSQKGDGSPHPRCYGTFVRVLGKYVREDKVLTLEDAIRKMTSLPASRMGLKDRGLLKEGNKADITIFDPKTVSEVGTFTDPHHYPIGIKHVLINGKFSIKNEEFIGKKNGAVLYGPSTL